APPCCPDVGWLVGRGITTGYPDGTYRPGDVVSRQSMAAFLHRFAGSPPFTPTGTQFSDVGVGHPFATEIEWLASTGIAGGYPDGTFRPTATVSRQSMAAFLHRMAEEPDPGASGPTFPDVPSGHQFVDEIEWLASTGIAGGYADGTFRPTAPVGRGAMAAFLHR